MNQLPKIELVLINAQGFGENRIGINEEQESVTTRFRVVGLSALRDAARAAIDVRLRERARQYAKEWPCPAELENARRNLEKAEGEVGELRRELTRVRADRESTVYRNSSKPGEQVAGELAKLDSQSVALEARLRQAEPGLQGLREAIVPYQDSWDSRFLHAIVRAAEELRIEVDNEPNMPIADSTPTAYFTWWLARQTQLGRLRALRDESGAVQEMLKIFPEHGDVWDRLRKYYPGAISW